MEEKRELILIFKSISMQNVFLVQNRCDVYEYCEFNPAVEANSGERESTTYPLLKKNIGTIDLN